jgi:hypothetical protein
MSEVIESSSPRQKKKRSENRKRTAQFRVRLTPGELDKFRAEAKAEDMDLAALIRLRMTGSKGPRTRGPKDEARGALHELRRELGYVGNNLNQLTRLANMGDMDRPADLDRALAQIMEVLDEVRRRLRGPA